MKKKAILFYFLKNQCSVNIIDSVEEKCFLEKVVSQYLPLNMVRMQHGGVCGKGPAPSADIKGSFKG